MVALHSDHGVNFIGGIPELLSAEREQVPMMIAARKIMNLSHSIQ